ncbi:MAG TPA: DinB family protein, partial [Thermoanaerobaculia bacterium]|nr:DinB family protein [Thermoanaerobaculia bacterium]
MKIKPPTALAAAVIALASAALAAAPPPAAPAAPAAAVATAAKTGFRAEFLHQLDDLQKKITSLAAAVPAEKYSWRPAPGVRSVGEVYMHLAAANLNLPRIWGVQPPAGIDPRGLEKQGDDKAKVAAALEQGFAHIRHAVETTPDADLDKAVKIFDHQGTVREAM